ncbi:MAG TPA: HEAT repeat domain-containing protein [Candidatus Sumerlaeota bacterium]|nr:HEAT repeat domain-containing protein [Candidatus Sumerlaeota bacterium]
MLENQLGVRGSNKMNRNKVVVSILTGASISLFIIANMFIFFNCNNQTNTHKKGIYVSSEQPISSLLIVSPLSSINADPIPQGFVGFKEWSETKRVLVVSELERDAHLSSEVIKFLKETLRDKDLSDLVRNNVANALLAQEPKDATLYRVFLDVVGDSSQSPTWRCYSIQFLAETLPYCANRVEVTKRLHDLTRDNDQTLASQAMMMLAYAADKGEVELEKSFDDRLIERLKAPNATDEMKMATLQLLGRRDMHQHVDLVREQVSKPSSYQRVAIASLGQLGDESDIARLEPLGRSHDNLVSAAAKSALARLKGKQ